MAESSLARKMKRKPEARAALLHAPAGYEAASFPGLEPAASTLTGSFDWIQLFAQNKAELDKIALRAAGALKSGGLRWISFPKGNSGLQTDLTRDKGWDVVSSLDLKWITLIWVNETWSAFSLRPYRQGEPRQSFR